MLTPGKSGDGKLVEKERERKKKKSEKKMMERNAVALNKQRGDQRSGPPSPTNIAPPRRAMRAERSERLRRDNKYRRAAPEPQPP